MKTGLSPACPLLRSILSSEMNKEENNVVRTYANKIESTHSSRFAICAMVD